MSFPSWVTISWSWNKLQVHELMQICGMLFDFRLKLRKLRNYQQCNQFCSQFHCKSILCLCTLPPISTPSPCQTWFSYSSIMPIVCWKHSNSATWRHSLRFYTQLLCWNLSWYHTTSLCSNGISLVFTAYCDQLRKISEHIPRPKQLKIDSAMVCDVTMKIFHVWTKRFKVSHY